MFRHKKSIMTPSKYKFVFKLSIYSIYLEHSDSIHVDLIMIANVIHKFKHIRTIFGCGIISIDATTL